jgi:hypothetical protein
LGRHRRAPVTTALPRATSLELLILFGFTFRIAMLPGYNPVVQAFMGTMFTWALTAAGAAVALVIKGQQVRMTE